MEQNRLESKEKYRDLLADAEKEGPQAVKHVMAELGKHDLFFLLVVLCSRKDIDRDWLFDRCREVQAEPNGYLDLWAREHFKSSIITFGLTIQDIISDPEITIGIFSINRPVAKKFLFQIKSELESNTALKELYPDVLWADPVKESPRWSLDEGIIVKRKGNPKEATLEANGLVDSLPTGRHYKIRVYDDIIDDKNVTNPDMILKSVQAWELSLNLGSTQISERYGTYDIERYIGTRYHFNDPYAEIMRRKAAKVRCYPGTIDGKEDGEPVLWDREFIRLKRQKMGPYIFNCQILQNPVADKAQGFKKEWLRFWDGNNLNNLNFYIICDPASSKKKGSDYTVFWVIGVGSDRKKYQIDTARDRLNLKERTDMLFFLHEKYKPLRVGYEKYGMQSDIEHIKGVQEQKNYRFDIVELGGQVAKEDRIRGLIPDFENGNIYLLNKLAKVGYDGRAYDVVEQFINDEYMSFPVSLHDDLLDGLARINDSDMKIEYPGEAYAYEDDYDDTTSDSRNDNTGY
jgi:phage terminase large subunit-like protein